jgi:3',5'-cyclic AMP phosphodiesterase CpdA
MLPPIESVSGDAPVSDRSCVEHGVWSPIPVERPAGALHLKFKNVDANEAQAIRERGVISFHAVGCSGNFKDHLPGSMVAKAMAAQINNPRVYVGHPASVGGSFLFHLGDLVYKDEDQADPDGKDQATMYNAQFYGQFANYSREIFAIPGNHDGKTSVKKKKWGIHHFLQNFCASKRERSPDDLTNAGKRLTMIQPYPYWLFETAVCYVVALYTNDINGGQLDDPMGTERPQYQWLVDTLKGIKEAANGKAVFLALHYPPYSGAGNFGQRGNPNLGPTQRRPDRELLPLGNILQQAFHESGQYPDVVLSAHAHFYQRITYTYARGRQIPYLICGSGGHGPVEKISTTCSGASIAPRSVPFDAILPVGLAIPNGDTVKVASYNDEDFGFLRLTVDKNQKIVIGEFFAAFSESNPNANLPILSDSFVLRLENHTINQ